MRSHSPRHPFLTFGVAVSLAAAVGLFAGCGGEPISPSESSSSSSSPAPTLATAGLGSWTEKALMPEANPRRTLTAGVVNNIVYVLGGYITENFEDHPSTAILAYDISTNRWSTKAAVFAGEETNGAVQIGSRLYVSGGDNHATGAVTAALFAYNPTTDRKARKADMPRRTGRGVSGVIDGKLYVLPSICIVGGERTACRFLYRYDPASNTWTTLAKAPTSHYPRALGGVIGGKLYVTGGGTNPTNRKRLDVYNPGSNSWTQLAPFPGGDQIAAGVLNGQLYVINSPGLETYAYNPQTNTWAIKAPYPRVDFNTSGPKALLKVTLNGVGRLIGVGGIQFDNTDKANHQAPSQMFTP